MQGDQESVAFFRFPLWKIVDQLFIISPTDLVLMLSTKTRLILQDILKRLSKNEPVTLEERILLKKHADRNSTVWHWLRKARSIQAKGHLGQESVTGFMQNMNLPGQLNEEHYNGSQDDLGDWFQGSPEWVRRS